MHSQNSHLYIQIMRTEEANQDFAVFDLQMIFLPFLTCVCFLFEFQWFKKKQQKKTPHHHNWLIAENISLVYENAFYSLQEIARNCNIFFNAPNKLLPQPWKGKLINYLE